MKIQDAKSIPIDDFLENLGHVCTKEVSGRKWYKRPYGNERTASFVLSADRRAWYDHGEGVGGNILDLAIKYGDLDSVSDALKFIEKAVGSGYTIPTIRQELPPVQSTPYYTLIDKKPFAVFSGRAYSKAAQYLNGRGIDGKIVQPYFHDVTYSGADGKKKAAFGMENISGGIEGRRVGDWAKIAIGHKDVSAFYANADHAPWHCFYSMIDFCTFLSVDKPPIGVYNYLIIHGDGLVDKATAFLETVPAGMMIHYPHNDQSGQKAYQRMLDATTELGWSGGDRAHLYEGFKDYTEAREKELGLNQKIVSSPQSAPSFKPRLG